MPITINGSGTVTGISAGGLPDACITTDELASTVNVAKAWVNFNGTGTVAIRASFNVSSITDNGTGDYTVNFTTAMVDANYCLLGTSLTRTGNLSGIVTVRADAAGAFAQFNTSGIRILTTESGNGTPSDPQYAGVAIFR